MAKKRNIALIGFMGAGKTTVSHGLKEKYGFTEIDTDQEIVKREGRAITEIFATDGETCFRKLEQEEVLRLQDVEGMVISCGGGLVMNPENVANLRKCSTIVFLTATPETALLRVKDSTDRPILNGHMDVDYIRALQEKRWPAYEAAADLRIATDGKDVDTICREIMEAVEAEP
ncbi:MAG TPA: shikimate kinase [Oribacterium sp.]|nr:shikimate kinase [Oribacterium sp.]